MSLDKLKEKIRNNKIIGNIYLKVAIFLKGKLSKEFFYFIITRPLKVRANKIVFCSFEGKGFSDNPKYIALELLKIQKYDIVWLVNDMNDKSVPDGIRKVKYGSFSGIYELATAKVWVDNCRKGWGTIKRSNQYYIHTGHGGIPLKKVEADAPLESVGLGYQMMAKHDSKAIDLILSNSKMKTEIVQNSYWYSGEIAAWGLPKIEALKIEDKYIEEKIKHHFSLDKGDRLAIYAPTFRSNDEKDIDFLKLDYKKILQSIESAFGGNWTLLVRMHPNIANMARKMELPDKGVVNATFYPDMQELMTGVEFMITDYSGTMFEMLQIQKPVFLYVPDLHNYNRGFYFNIEELPFPIAKSEKELCNKINLFDKKEYIQKVDEFKARIGLIENRDAAFKCAERIVDVIENKESYRGWHL